MRSIFITVLFIFFSAMLHAQIESAKAPIIMPENNNKLNTPVLKFPSILNNTNNNNNNTTTIGLEKEKKNLMKMEDFLDPGDYYEKKLNKGIMTEGKDNQMGATTTQFLGDFRVKGKFVKILCRDHQYVDGDRVKIYLNDVVVQPNVVLSGNFKGFTVDMQNGFNKIDFQALNQGESAPNTAQLVILDDNGNVVSSNQWNLATGVKATVIIVKE